MMKHRLDLQIIPATLRYLPIAIVALTFGQSAFAQIKASVSQIGDATHMEFIGATNWDYQVEREGNNIVLEVPKLDTPSLLSVKDWKDPLIKSISIEDGPDGKSLINIEVTGKEVESFDYLTDEPSRLIVDLYKAEPKEKPTTAKKESKTKSKSSTKVAETSTRKPAGADFIEGETIYDTPAPVQQKDQAAEVTLQLNDFGVFDGTDPNFDRFTIKKEDIDNSAIIASKRNIYITFPMLEHEDGYLEKLWAAPPKYEIAPENDEENKLVRFLNKLFEEKKYATFFETLKEFRDRYPQSDRYDELIAYMEADIYYNLWREKGSPSDFEVAAAKYKEILITYPKSKLAERIALLLGYSYIYKKDAFGAVSAFERYLRTYENSPFRHSAKITISRSFALIRKYNKALEVLDSVEQDESAGAFRAEAALRKGDIHFKAGNFKAAAAAYIKAKKRFPASWKKFPNAQYNLAEARFANKDYFDSLNTYVEFLRTFPKSSHGGYAMTRIGELLGILGAPQKKVLGAYLESMFRYQGSEGANIAKIRVTSSRMTGMKQKDIDSTVSELDEFVESSNLPNIVPFYKVAISDGYFNRAEFDRARSILVNFYKENPTSKSLPVIKTRIVRTIISQIRNLKEQGNSIETLRVYGQHAGSWLKNSNRIDLTFYIGEAFEKAGATREAAIKYRKALNQLYAIEGTVLEEERGVFEALPKKDSLNLRLAATAIKQGQHGDAFKYLKDIGKKSELTIPEEVERVEIAAQVAENRGQEKAAIVYLDMLTKSWKGKPEQVSRPLAKLAEIQEKLGKNRDALTTIQRINVLQEDTNEVPLDLHLSSLELEAKIHLKMKDVPKAIKSYEKLLRNYEDDRELGSIRYQVGELYFQLGDVKSAEKTWSQLKPTQVWFQMAQEQLQHSKFKDDYKKYINRIPAMAGLRGKEDK